MPYFNTSLLNNKKTLEIKVDYSDCKIIFGIFDEKNIHNNDKLEDCVNVLNSHFYIIPDKNIIILMINDFSENSNIKKITYEFYIPLNNTYLEKLNSSFCDEIFETDIPKNFTEILEQSKMNIISDLSIDNNEMEISSIIYDKTIDYISDSFDINNNNNDSDEINNTNITKNTYRADNNNSYEIFNNNIIFYSDIYNINDNKNKKCFYSCESCEKNGNNTIHNCQKCKLEYLYQLKINNYLNCYEYCHNNTYDEINDLYLCLEEQICFGGNKLIPEKNNLCIDICNKDNTYKYEF